MLGISIRQAKDLPVTRNAAAINPDDSPRDKVRPILRAARAIFLRHGYGAASMDQVARDAGVSKATLYVYFSSKRDLFAAIVLEERDHYVKAPEIGSTRALLRTNLKQFASGIVDFLLSPESVATYRMVVAEAGRFPELGRAFHANGPAKLLAYVAEHLRRAMTGGLLRRGDAEQAAEHFIGLVRGDLQLLALLGVERTRSNATIDAVVMRGVDAFLKVYSRPSVRSCRPWRHPSVIA